MLTAALVERGDEVRALVRGPSDILRLPQPPPEPVEVSLDDEASLVRALRGCELVYHLAGVNTLCPADPLELYRVNVAGTSRLLRAAARAGVRRVVVTSSAVTLGHCGRRPVSEVEPGRLGPSHYARSKAAGERAALAASGVEVVAVNPSSVQGPGRRSGSARLLLAYLNGALPVIVNTTLGWCYTGDCVQGHLAAAEHGVPGARYVLNSGNITTADLLARLGEAAGLTQRPRRVPGGVLVATATAAAKIPGLASMPLGGMCWDALRTLARSHVYDGSRAQRELGLVYTPLETALRETLAWYDREGLLRRDLAVSARPTGTVTP